MLMPLAKPSLSGSRRERRVASWSRRTVRQIIGRPKEYVVSRVELPVKMARPKSATSADAQAWNGGAASNHEEEGRAPAECILPDKAELKTTLRSSQWTRAKDEELRRRLDVCPVIASFESAELRVRAALVLHVNDLVLPLLPLVNTSAGGRGPLGVLMRKCRHLILNEAKLSLLLSR